ncbi:MAG: hypothetical protein ACLTWO_07145 [Blautia massiliensis (ex Durand et al. 2017)]
MERIALCTFLHTREKLNIRRKIVIVQPGQTKTATGRILSGGCALVLSIFVKVPNQGDMLSDNKSSHHHAVHFSFENSHISNDMPFFAKLSTVIPLLSP